MIHNLDASALGADRQPIAVEGHAHWRLETAEAGVEMVPLVADHDELAGLEGGDHLRGAQLPQRRGEVRRVNRTQRRIFCRWEAR